MAVRGDRKARQRASAGEAQAGPGSGKGSRGASQERISRKQQAENTRRKLAETALRLFADRGYDSVAVDDICHEAGVSKGTFYLYFASKDQVVVDEFLALDRSYQDALPEIGGIKTAVGRLEALGRYSLRHISALGKDYIKAAYSSQMAPGRGPSPLASRERASHLIVLRLVKEAQESGELRRDLPAEEIALALTRATRGIVIEWCLTDGAFDLEQAGGPLLAILMDGLRARKGDTPPGETAAPAPKRRG